MRFSRSRVTSRMVNSPTPPTSAMATMHEGRTSCTESSITKGCLASVGKSFTRSMAARSSLSEDSCSLAARLTSHSTSMLESPAEELLVRSSMPLTSWISSSSLVVMRRSISSADAPAQLVLTMAVLKEISGNT